MSLCASCGLPLTGDAVLCPHHRGLDADDWGAVNRMMCDFLHRGKLPSRLGASERRDGFPVYAGEAA